MLLRTRIIIAVLALGSAAVGVFGDPWFAAIGAPGLGRPIVAFALLLVGIVYFAWTSYRFHAADKKAEQARRDRQAGK